LVLAALLGAQAAGLFPTATTIDALTTYPGFYHLKDVLVRAELKTDDRGQSFLSAVDGEGRAVQVLLPPDERSLGGQVQVRGQFLDVGRLDPADSQATARTLRSIVEARLGSDRWPAQGELLMLTATNVSPAPPPSATPTVRQLALQPRRYEGEVVTVAGQFGGRNLFGDLAQSPRAGLVEFVLRAAGGAVWVVGLPPRGRGWELRPDARVDTAQWLEVAGKVRAANGLVWLEATRVERTTAKAQEEPPRAPAVPVAPPQPPEVIFSLPSEDDTDVPPATAVRIQVSRDLNPDTLEGHIAVGYLGRPAGDPPIPFKASFDRSQRVLQLVFHKPFEAFTTVKVDLLEGIKGTDGQPMKPWALTFSTGR
ncbi:MAG: hypothetical protein EHM24_01315, partial [Acidobacteria bacterium]